MWDSLLRELPKIIFAIFGGILFLYREIKSNKTLKENTQATKDNAEATKESMDKINEAQASITLMMEEAKEITNKQQLASDEALRLAQEKLKESDNYITELMSKKKDSNSSSGINPSPLGS